MKVGIYPGSFNPWHAGHTDVLNKALKVFEKVIIIRLMNPEKLQETDDLNFLPSNVQAKSRIQMVVSDRTLKEMVDHYKPDAVIRGLRNGNDLQYEMNQQYWNEDLGIKIPYVYFITDRTLAHVSSSAIRNVIKLGLEHKY